VIGDDGSHLYGAGSKGEKTLKAEKLISQGHNIKIISEKAFLAMVQGGGEEAEEEEVEDEVEEEAPPPKKAAAPPPPKARAKAPPPPEDDDEEEQEEEDEEEAPPPKKKAAASAPPKPKAKAAPPPDDEDEEEQEDEADEDESSDDEDDNPTYTTRYGAVTWRQSLVNDDEDKFWKIEVRGTHHFATFGKNGTTGQVRLTNMGVASAAKTDAEKRAMAKRKEGYRIVK
jgi:predicted DNA-binding WGR domain protein